MTLRDFFSVLNFKVKYKVIDRFTNEVIEFPKNNRRHLDLNWDRKIYMVFQSDDGTLEIYLY